MSDAAEARSGSRNQTLDGLKYVAAGAIVLHHVAAYEVSTTIGAFLTTAAATALFFFFAVSGYLHGSIGGRGGAWRVKRLVRLGIPYAFWSVVYLAWAARVLLHGGTWVPPNPLVVIFFAGAHGILWFLPMLLACALLCDVLVRDARARRVAIVACVVATLALYWSGVAAGVPADWQNFVLAPRWLLVYLGGMELRAKAPVTTSLAKFAPAAALVAVLGAGLAGVAANSLPIAATLTLETTMWVVGSLAVLLGAASGAKWLGVAKLAWGRDFLLGVYLSHVLWLSQLTRLLPPTALPAGAWIPITWALTFAAASVTTLVLLSTRWTRPVVV